MFAVVSSGGKQYKVRQNEIVKIDKIEGNVGDKVKLDNVLMLSKDDDIVELSNNSDSNLESCYVESTILEQKRDKKVIVFKKKRRKNHRRKQGHRSFVTIVRIDNFVF